MLKKITILIIFLYILALAQTSLLARFDIRGYQINFVIIAVVLICLFAPRRLKERDKWSAEWLGIVSALAGGFFLSMFSNYPFGFEILILVCAAALIKFIIKRYVWI